LIKRSQYATANLWQKDATTGIGQGTKLTGLDFASEIELFVSKD
jgi:hypothetical protein